MRFQILRLAPQEENRPEPVEFFNHMVNIFTASLTSKVTANQREVLAHSIKSLEREVAINAPVDYVKCLPVWDEVNSCAESSNFSYSSLITVKDCYRNQREIVEIFRGKFAISFQQCRYCFVVHAKFSNC